MLQAKKKYRVLILTIVISFMNMYSQIAANPTRILSGKTICIDAGHGLTKKKYNEKIAPTSTKTKPAFVSGTKGAKYTEEQLNLIVALKLQKALEELGARIVMTRETHETTLSNIDRAKLANESKADIMIRIHADAGPSASVAGMSVLVPGPEYQKNPGVVQKSKTLGEMILKNCVAETGAKNRGITVHSDMTGLNWPEMPVIILEMGFMTNKQEDALLSTPAYQDKIVAGIEKGVLEYFGIDDE
jgi:N-acetylmuramoyl-L-alanine amidase